MLRIEIHQHTMRQNLNAASTRTSRELRAVLYRVVLTRHNRKQAGRSEARVTGGLLDFPLANNRSKGLRVPAPCRQRRPLHCPSSIFGCMKSQLDALMRQSAL